MHLVLRIQRAIKKRSLEKWLQDQAPQNHNWKKNNWVAINKHQLEMDTGAGQCRIF